MPCGSATEKCLEWAREIYSVVPDVQIQTSGERMPGRVSPPGNTQELFQKAAGTPAAQRWRPSIHLAVVRSYLREVFPKPRCFSGGVATWTPSSPPSKYMPVLSVGPAMGPLRLKKAGPRFAANRCENHSGKRSSDSDVGRTVASSSQIDSAN